MRPRTNDLLNEIDKLRAEGSAVQQLSTKLLAHEAAMRLIARHNLWEELAKEMRSLTTP